MATIRSATLEVLNALAWRQELASRPSLETWLKSYDASLASCLNKPGMKRLEALGYLKKIDSGSGWTYQISAEGHKVSSHAFDPEERWKRPWNGEWTFLMFDVDAKDWKSRTRLQRWMKEEKFGKLQGSIWITPEFNQDLKSVFREMEIDGKSFFLFKGRDDLALIDAGVIDRAWHFDLVREAYRRYIDWAEPVCTGRIPGVSFIEWQVRELDYWRRVLELDPFLPETLCPTDYPGKKAWKLRKGLGRH